MKVEIPSKLCKCGYTHPPPWDNNCPVLEANKLKESEKGQKIIEMCSTLSKFLNSREDYEKIIERLKIFVAKM